LNCHGRTGRDLGQFSEGLRPIRPTSRRSPASSTLRTWFWVIKNGINMTGMPSFGLIEVPDKEIWSIVAFIKKLPTVSDADFKAWSTQP